MNSSDVSKSEMEVPVMEELGVLACPFRLSLPLLFGGLIWGGITAFSLAAAEQATMMQGLALVLAFWVSLLSLGPLVLLVPFRNFAGVMLVVHVLVACASGMRAESESASILRSASLIPAFSICLAAAAREFRTALSLRMGLTLGGVLLVGSQAFNLNATELLDAHYRHADFLGPNGISFVAAIVGVSALEFTFSSWRTRLERFGWLIAFGACALLIISTKSRTGTLAFLVGITVLVIFQARSLRVRLLVGAALAAIAALAFFYQSFLVDVFMLDDKHRSVLTGTGRFAVWRYVLCELWPTAPVLGVGPGMHNDMVLMAAPSDSIASTSAHNGLLVALAETGLLGTVPLLLLLLSCAKGVFRDRSSALRPWAVATFAAGLTESMGESMLFSMGNPASLLFLLAVAALALPVQPDADQNDHQESNESG